MKCRISKQFDFDAAHWLPMVAPEHKCHRMHGHTYRVEIICEGELDRRGMVCDYSEIAAVWEPMHKVLDHHVLNEIEGLANPTTEWLCAWIWERVRHSLTRAVCIKVYESATTWCERWKPTSRLEDGTHTP